MTSSSSDPQCSERPAALGGQVATLATHFSRCSFPRAGGPPEALPGWIVELRLPEVARLLLAILWRWRATKRFVNRISSPDPVVT